MITGFCKTKSLIHKLNILNLWDIKLSLLSYLLIYIYFYTYIVNTDIVYIDKMYKFMSGKI